ncbi:nucleotidyltransferase domain-containing protein [Hydrogenophaga sp. 2FB]|uniref:type VII toxin-antitoxin system MntA family adenylyltransferase antitoxin n=1 Tax=Hydrogenophaga sp. 2FB TaxID=2502187 RepID=UPI0010F8D572|nr:nucleotidyltransferase domain-containing protein [Hydrogenophaga sp. 2FB]
MSTHALPSDDAIAAAVVAVVPSAKAVWLFGSAVNGRWRAGSDLDIAVQLPGRWSPSERFDVAMALGARLNVDVDLLEFQRLDTVMQVQILETGRLLIARDPVALLQYEGFLRTEYQNIQRWRQPMVRALADRLATSGGRP